MDCTRGHQTLVEGEGGASARLTQHQIAAMTGSMREVVQRALKALERDGAIRLELARVVVLDPNALGRWRDAEAARTRPGFSLADQCTLVAVGAFSVSTVIPS
ncbi:MAG: helix-turn-helix domain-containing protein [Candidatus Methylomirabilales bacterium]